MTSRGRSFSTSIRQIAGIASEEACVVGAVKPKGTAEDLVLESMSIRTHKAQSRDMLLKGIHRFFDPPGVRSKVHRPNCVTA